MTGVIGSKSSLDQHNQKNQKDARRRFSFLVTTNETLKNVSSWIEVIVWIYFGVLALWTRAIDYCKMCFFDRVWKVHTSTMYICFTNVLKYILSTSSSEFHFDSHTFCMTYIEQRRRILQQVRQEPHLSYLLDAYDKNHHESLARYRSYSSGTRKRLKTSVRHTIMNKKNRSCTLTFPIRIGTDCSGIEAPITALQLLRVPYHHVFSTEIDQRARETIRANYNPGGVHRRSSWTVSSLGKTEP